MKSYKDQLETALIELTFEELYNAATPESGPEQGVTPTHSLETAPQPKVYVMTWVSKRRDDRQ